LSGSTTQVLTAIQVDSHEDQGRELYFITNQTSWTASDVALAYKERWHIEVFFKLLKQHLSIHSSAPVSMR